MSLEEKLIEVANSLKKEANRYPRMKTIDVVNMLINISKMEFEKPKQCVQICDEFANNFITWLWMNDWEQIEENKYCNAMIFGEFKTTTELLEIYKQGL